MLDNTTKQKIDSLRNLLVGKVPDPKSQVEQITIALFYKFMWDRDKEIKDLGGNATFFVGEFEKYSWENLFAPDLGGSECIKIYSEAIEEMENNPNIPSIFRDIFKRAFLPYNDPYTLRLFLKEVNDFHYSNSEKLGDGFEYLLNILGTQGDAGQFRTPRHIIDFITEVVNPQKGDRICDPACGTAGFIISAYKHILKTNTKESLGDLLTPEDKKRLGNNLVGLDIDPMMVKLALANMYLHGLNEPHIYEYDSLTSKERWNEKYDVILANPPFMTPKGGIRPHKLFGIDSKRAEVLFTDFISSHLSLNGKAAIVVPNGIVSNKGSAYKSLRKNLISNGLYAIVQLHGSVFKPYANAQTSILFLDKNVNKKYNKVLFLRLNNDGFKKGETRVEINENDIPEIINIINKFKLTGELIKTQLLSELVLNDIVEKKDDLFVGTHILNQYEWKHKCVKISDIFNLEKGALQSTKKNEGSYTFITASEEFSSHDEYTHNTEAIVIAVSAGGSLGRTHYINDKFIASDLCIILSPKKKSEINLLFYKYYFPKIRERMVAKIAKGSSKLSINQTDLSNFKIEFPPIELQNEFVELIKPNINEIEKLKIDIREKKRVIQDKMDEIV